MELSSTKFYSCQRCALLGWGQEEAGTYASITKSYPQCWAAQTDTEFSQACAGLRRPNSGLVPGKGTNFAPMGAWKFRIGLPFFTTTK